MAIIPGKLCGTVTGFALSTLAIISSPVKIRNEGTRKNCISAEMSENGRESNTLYENENGRWKGAQYVVKRSYAPQGAYVEADEWGKAELYVYSEALKPEKLTYRLALREREVRRLWGGRNVHRYVCGMCAWQCPEWKCRTWTVDWNADRAGDWNVYSKKKIAENAGSGMKSTLL